MDLELINIIQQLNPWLADQNKPILEDARYINRSQTDTLLMPAWDSLCTVLIGPRRAGKTTLGFYLCQEMLRQQRFTQLLYLNCDYFEIRQWLTNPLFLEDIKNTFKLERFILYIDEAQRLQNAGILLKSIVDLHLPIKILATGSSQLELKNHVQEHLTGRNIEALVLPFSQTEATYLTNIISELLIYGSYPEIVRTQSKSLLLQQLYRDYISKDIIEILKIGHADVIQKLIILMAHSAGQLVNYQQLAVDCRVSSSTVQHYLSILEHTYVLHSLKPFVGNKRTEITTNPKYYFIDNGFRNQALRNFLELDKRTDVGFLVENYIFQEIYKFKTQYFLDVDLYFWRTKAGAEVDFVLYKNSENIIAIESKYRNMNSPIISRGMRSFIDAYQPKLVILITKTYINQIKQGNSDIYFTPLEKITEMYPLLLAIL